MLQVNNSVPSLGSRRKGLCEIFLSTTRNAPKINKQINKKIDKSIKIHIA